MSAALQMLVGAALAVSIDYAWGVDGLIALAVTLFIAELVHDLRLYRQPDSSDRDTAYRRWEAWHG